MKSTHNNKKSLGMLDSFKVPAIKQDIKYHNPSVDMVEVSRLEELKYLYASNVNVSNFVSVKLSGELKYHVWKAQMLCLMESQKMRGIVDAKFDGPGATSVEIMKQYDSLLRGWILGSLSEDVLSTIVDLKSAKLVWRKLKSIYDPEISPQQDSNSSEQLTETEIVTVIETENKDNVERNKKLRKATVEGRWWEAEAILKNCKDAATKAISNDGNTMLHLAVGIGQNDFVEKLLNFIKDGEDIESKNSDGRTALHIAAIVGNKYAAELLVKKRRELLGISDHKAYVPLVSAYYNMQLVTFVYLLEATETKQQPLPIALYPGSGVKTGVNLLITAIFTKEYDLALALVNIYPELATKDYQVLMAIARTFPSELDYGERLIYPLAPIKHIEKKKKDYKDAKHIVNLVCNQIDKLSFSGTHHPCYSRPILEAACQGAYEVVDEILKIYNLIYHIVERTDYYRTIMDASKNNILHLAGKLAPLRILNRTTGGALQLQRDLQWREEVKKLVFPTYLTKENIFKETPEMEKLPSTTSNSINDPLYISNSDHPGMVLTLTPFNGSNFLGWSRTVKMALGAKLKLGFINGTCVKPAMDGENL
ncbi:ankyrin repeat-containing protein [Tanacetum coccineum]|uniref:Ankyrin repeat-containing protein n=1 Tax=Tanacetum coccineum TaxID=301880 RepID=A0ABQ4Y8J7_9ASTR